MSYLYYILPTSQRLYKEWSLWDLKGNVLYFTQGKYSLWTSRDSVFDATWSLEPSTWIFSPKPGPPT